MEEKKKRTCNQPLRKYNDKIVEDAVKWFYAGGSLTQFCKTIGISTATFYQWKAKFPEFKQACEAGIDFTNTEKVETALLRSCKDRWLTKTKERYDKKGKLLGRDIYTYVLPADVGAIKFYLMNRGHERWKEASKLDLGAGDGRDVQFSIVINDKEQDADQKTDKEKVRSGADSSEIPSIGQSSTRH